MSTSPTLPPGVTPSRLARRLGLRDAVVLGLGSMIGAGVFAALAPAARAAGNGLLLGLGLAAAVAYCNATSSAQLAAIYPESGGAYVYGRKRLGEVWGFVAGFGFVVGKLASCSAMALTFGSYAAPSQARSAAIVAVLALTALDYLGVQKSAAVTRVLVAFVLSILALVVGAVWLGGATDVARLWPLRGVSTRGVLEAAGLLFFAFAGYARLATLGEEVIDPERTIPRAIPLALGITLVVYLVVSISALAAVGASALGASEQPLASAVRAGRFAAVAPLVRLGAALASLGVLMSLIMGVSRTVFAMAAKRDVPAFFAAVHPRYRIPHRAEIGVGLAIVVLTAFADLRSVIGFSSFAVLCYYAITNAAAWTLAAEERRWPRALSALGLLGCLTLAFSLPAPSVWAGAALLACGVLVNLAWRRARGSAAAPGPRS
jgi:APA family basic amino acid/polyamine antiporter